MKAVRARGKHVGRPSTPVAVTGEIERLARETELSIRQIQDALSVGVGRGVVGQIVKGVRSGEG